MSDVTAVIARETRRARIQELTNELEEVVKFMFKKKRPVGEIVATITAYANEIDRLERGAPRVTSADVPTVPEPYLAADEDVLAAWDDTLRER